MGFRKHLPIVLYGVRAHYEWFKLINRIWLRVSFPSISFEGSVHFTWFILQPLHKLNIHTIYLNLDNAQ